MKIQSKSMCFSFPKENENFQQLQRRIIVFYRQWGGLSWVEYLQHAYVAAI